VLDEADGPGEHRPGEEGNVSDDDKGKVIRFTRYDRLPDVAEGSDLPEWVDGWRKLKEASDRAQDWMCRKMIHDVSHEERTTRWGGAESTTPAHPEPGCYFCSWAYKFSRFFHEAWWWQTLCDGCDQFMWRCNYGCEMWEDPEED
jgi:hypothetical protein